MNAASPEPTQDQNRVHQDTDLSVEEQERLEDLHLYVRDGLVTPETADRMYGNPPRQEGQS
jgi:hypothetical protein